MTTVSRPEMQTPAAPAAQTPKRMTLAEFVALGEGPPYYEFEDGIMIPRNGEENPMVSPASRHQRLLSRLASPMDQHASAYQLGDVFIELDVFLPDGKLYIPDITFIAANGRAYLDPADDKIHGAPLLVVEILSKNTRRDRVRKLRVYQSNGIEWYWIIDPNTLVLEQHQFLPDGNMLTTIVDVGEDFQPVVLPGLTLNLAALMGELPAPDDVAPDVAANDVPLVD